jgi:group I intron endonuclease
MLSISSEQREKYFTQKSRGGVIYKITNTLNNDFYIGSTQNFIKRYYTHINHIRTNKQSCTKLIRAINKYGENNFKFEIIEECQKDQIIIREQYYLDTLLPQYNIAKIAGSNVGIKRTRDTKELKSIQQKNNWQNIEYKKKHLNFLSKNWKSGEEHVMSKLTTADVIKIKTNLQLGYKPKQISEMLGYSYHSVKDISRGKTWKKVII